IETLRPVPALTGAAIDRKAFGARFEDLDLVADGDFGELSRHGIPTEEDAFDSRVGGHSEGAERAERLVAGGGAGQLIFGRDDTPVAGFDELELGVADADALPEVVAPGLMIVDHDAGAEAAHGDGALALARELGVDGVERAGRDDENRIGVGEGD